MNFSFHVNVFIDVAIVLILVMQPLLGETASQQTVWLSHKPCSLRDRRRGYGIEASTGADVPHNLLFFALCLAVMVFP